MYSTLPVLVIGSLPSRSSIADTDGGLTIDNTLDDVSLEDVELLAGDSDRAEGAKVSSASTVPKVDEILDLVECGAEDCGDRTTFARARFATETCLTIVAGVTVMVEMLESRFSLSREKLTWSSSRSCAVSTDVAGEVVEAGVSGGNRELGAGLNIDDFELGV